MSSNYLVKGETMTSDILTTVEAADYVRLKKPTLERFRLTGEGPRFYKLGGAVRYRRHDLDAWLETRAIRSTSEYLHNQDEL
jgi:excisionase family DNA binding protein